MNHPDGREWTQRTYRFENGYAASVITGGYGNDEYPYEIAVMHGETIVYDTPITEDVIGYLNGDGVARVLSEIAALPKR